MTLSPWLVTPVVLAVGLPGSLIDRLLYFPDRWMPITPREVQERWITTEDGTRIHAWYTAASDEAQAPTLLWAHGNGGNIGGRYEVQAALTQRGLNVLAYDYRGYGRSEGTPSESGLYLDARAAFDSLVAAGTSPARIVCLGESLGGAVSIELATARPCAGVAVVSTFTDIAAVARTHYGPLGFLAGGRFDSLSRVRRLRTPLFVAHGDLDDIVPYPLGRALYEAAVEPKEFHRIEGAGHNDVFLFARLLDAIAAFARRTTGLEPEPGEA